MITTRLWCDPEAMHAKENAEHPRTATQDTLLSALMLAVSWLAGCAHEGKTLIPLNDAPLDPPSAVARLNEGSKHPLLLRGLDQRLLAVRMQNTLSDHDYVVTAGRHVLWLMSAPYGLPLIPQRIRCYVIDAELEGGARYRLEEDMDQKLARVLRADTGERIASGQLVDEPWIFSRNCRWQ
jgi:hypothetical protein